MSIFNKIMRNVRRTDCNTRAVDTFTDRQVIQMDDRPDVTMGGFVYKHRLDVTLRVEFWANSANFRQALEQAEDRLMNTMYADVLAELQRIRECVYAGDATGVMRIVDALEKSIHGGEQ